MCFKTTRKVVKLYLEVGQGTQYSAPLRLTSTTCLMERAVLEPLRLRSIDLLGCFMYTVTLSNRRMCKRESVAAPWEDGEGE